MASRGYTKAIIDEVHSAPSDKLGVQLALACIENNMPVAQVAMHLKLTRTTVYSWFRGRTDVPPKHRQQVQAIIDSLE